MTVLLIGKNSMVARAFIRLYEQKHVIIAVGKEDDITNLALPQRLDAVIFLAQSADYKSAIMTEDLYRINVNLLFQCLNRVKDITEQFIYCSTGSVYGETLDGLYTEQSPLHNVSATPYVATKLMGEQLMQSFGAIGNRIILRPFFIYGKAQKEGMLFSTLYSRIKSGETLKLTGKEGLIFNPVYADDVAVLMEQLSLSGTPSGVSVYNVAGAEEVSLRSIIELMATGLGKPAIVEENEMPVKRMIAQVNIPGWRPVTNITEGITNTFFDV